MPIFLWFFLSIYWNVVRLFPTQTDWVLFWWAQLFIYFDCKCCCSISIVMSIVQHRIGLFAQLRAVSNKWRDEPQSKLWWIPHSAIPNVKKMCACLCLCFGTYNHISNAHTHACRLVRSYVKRYMFRVLWQFSLFFVCSRYFAGGIAGASNVLKYHRHWNLKKLVRNFEPKTKTGKKARLKRRIIQIA